MQLQRFLPADEDAWVEAICRLVDDDQLRERLANAGRQTVESKFSVELWAPVLVEIIRKAAGK